MSVAVHVEQKRAPDTLGASEAATALGLNRYESPYSLWRKLRGLPVHEKPNPIRDEAAEWGQALEPIVRGKYALRKDVRVFVPQNSETLDGWLRCTPDGYVVSMENARSLTQVREVKDLFDAQTLVGITRASIVGLLQCKTASAYLLDDWLVGPPAQYEVQCRVEMAVCGLPWNDLVCLVGGQRYVQHRITRDLDIEARILRDLRVFWQSVKDGVEPPVDDSQAWRDEANDRMERSRSVEVIADEQAVLYIDAWRAARAARIRATENEEEEKNRVLLAMSAAGCTKFDAGRLGKPTAYKSKGVWNLRAPAFWKGDE